MKNKYRIEGDIVYIEINCKGKTLETMIDLEDFDLVNSYKGKWYGVYSKSADNYYCYISIKTNNKWKPVEMYRIIMNLNDKKLVIDHIYHNTLDNRKSQLRVVTRQENSQNKLNIKGYYWSNSSKKWMAQIGINNKSIYLGGFNTEEEAK